jgi:signal transduction histidine kinase/CheY-like chemotaxis protein
MRRRRRPRPARSSKQLAQLLQALIDLYQLLRTARPLDELLDAILTTALRSIPGAQRGSIMVREDAVLVYRAAVGYNLAMLRKVRLPADEVADMALGQTRVVQYESFVNWDEQHLDGESNAILREYGFTESIRCSMIAPIFVEKQFYGSIVLDNLRDHTPFPVLSKTLATVFAEQAGLLIEHALAQEQLHTTARLLADADRLAALGRLVSGVAHEINNPLTAVFGHADMLESEALSDEGRESLVQLGIGAERVRSIVRNLLAFARQQYSGFSEIDLNALVRQTLALERKELRHANIEVTLDLCPDLPASWGDAGQIAQVILNLILNARYALSEQNGPRNLTIRSSRRLVDDGTTQLVLTVSDNGPGMPLEVQSRIFDPFFTTRQEGTGLGLSVCYGIVKEHGGTITVESVLGQGTAMHIALPVVSGPPATAETPVQVQVRSAPQGLQLLIIDDDEVVINVLGRALTPGNTLVTASNGELALKLLDGQRFDLILCDLKMPTMSGPLFYKALRSVRPDATARLLFMSGDSNSAETLAFLRSSGRPLLLKPFTLSELYQAIGGIIDRA